MFTHTQAHYSSSNPSNFHRHKCHSNYNMIAYLELFNKLNICESIFSSEEQNIGITANNIIFAYLWNSAIVKLIPFFIDEILAKSCVVAASHASIMIHNTIKVIKNGSFWFICCINNKLQSKYGPILKFSIGNLTGVLIFLRRLNLLKAITKILLLL